MNLTIRVVLAGFLAVITHLSWGQEAAPPTNQHPAVDPISPVSKAKLIIISRLPLNSDKANDVWTKFTDADKTTLNVFCMSDHANNLPTTVGSIEGKGKLDVCTSSRFLSDKGDTLRVVYVDVQTVPNATYNANPSNYRKDHCLAQTLPPLAITQSSRKTAIQQNVSDFVKFLIQKNAGGGSQGAEAPDNVPRICSYLWQDILLNDEVGTVTIKATAPADPSFNDSSTATTVVTTGPHENVFLTGDAVVTNLKQLQYDSTSHAVTEKTAPTQLYLGVNYMVGDLYEQNPWLSTNRIVGKVLLSATKRPFDSVGVGIGYRFADGIYTSDTTTNSGFEIWAGRMWTKGDALNSDGTVQSNGSTTKTWAVGVSYSIGTLMSWLK